MDADLLHMHKVYLHMVIKLRGNDFRSVCHLSQLLLQLHHHVLDLGDLCPCRSTSTLHDDALEVEPKSSKRRASLEKGMKTFAQASERSRASFQMH